MLPSGARCSIGACRLALIRLSAAPGKL